MYSSRALLLSLSGFLGVACGESQVADAEEDSISGIAPGKIGYQVIGNCWAYTTTAWLEALHVRAGGTRIDFSEAYLTYWNMFDGLVAPQTASLEVSNFNNVSRTLVQRGIMFERQFAPIEGATAEASALADLKKWIASGALERAPTEAVARRKYMRAAVDDAWKLSPGRRAAFDALFGSDLSKTLVGAPASVLQTYGVVRPSDLTVAIYQPRASAPRVGRLSELVNDSSTISSTYFRKPDSTLRVMFFPSGRKPVAPFTAANVPAYYDGEALTFADQRTFFRQIQRVLHQGIPVWGSWWVDTSARQADSGAFVQTPSLMSARDMSKVSYGGHASLFIDYQAKLADGTLLEAGKSITDPNLLRRSLDKNTVLQFFRIQNSWGANGVWPNRPPGTYDLSAQYLSEPKNLKCRPGPNGSLTAPTCTPDSFFNTVALPLNIEP